MRFISAIAAIALLLTPSALADAPSGDWAADTTVTVTSSLTNTLTITKTLTYAFAHTNTTSTYSSQSTSWNATTHSHATTINTPTLTATSSLTPSETSAAPTIASIAATGAASVQEVNLAVAALAGAAVMFWGSL
ncbi:hypothetical protein A1O3_01076 [Capronia epimyces CBS 606.96]|uniref:Uncharacterized protein n=1 Tax=Capronia epimyces CBS 606.96 TaxID=1182542 RepID=W9ZDC6_9EURO|nr:uncharacterized protein A1O3_01076 [Capronia epimyces CBS 606.96]EXJ92524.1 hypothetical protein A1O3_01076 [Capronia epimyces CBS 606.96]